MSVAFKELSELLDGAELAIADIKEVMADGKLDLRDIGVLIKISGHLAKYNAAIQGLANLTLANLALMSQDEITAVVARVMNLLGVVGVLAVK